MTNILQLPQLDGSATSLTISANSDWLDGFFFAVPGSPTVVSTLVGAITSGQNTITLATSISQSPASGLVPGMPIAQTPGIPQGAFIGAITSATTLTIVNAAGAALNATLTDVEAYLIFQPIPLDITGIAFRCDVRTTTQTYLTAQTADGSMANGGTTGVLNFNVLQSTIGPKFGLAPGSGKSLSAVFDILAIADGHIVNLFQAGAASIKILAGTTAAS